MIQLVLMYNTINAKSSKTCSCFGHSDIVITDELKEKLRKCYRTLVEEGFGTFYFGGLSMFDDLCWQVVSELKKEYPQIRRVFCLTDRRHLRPSKRPKDLRDEDFEEFVYLELEFDFYKTRLYFRNVEMIKQSDFVVFYVNKTGRSGAYKAMQFAEKTKKKFVNFGACQQN